MFSQTFRERLEIGKYTSWASDLTEERLFALLWAVGEFGERWTTVVGFLERNLEDYDGPDTIRAARAKKALELIGEIYRRAHLDEEGIKRRVLQACADVQDRYKYRHIDSDGPELVEISSQL